MKRILFLMIFILALNCTISAQIKRVLIGIDGLTCSACSYATEKSIRTLNFVKDVEFGLNTNVATITFVPGKQIDLDALSQKVRDAAFSVRSLNLIIAMNGINVENDFRYKFENTTFHFVKIAPQKISGDVNLKVLGKNFLNKKEYKKWSTSIGGNAKVSGLKKEYYVTL